VIFDQNSVSTATGQKNTFSPAPDANQKTETAVKPSEMRRIAVTGHVGMRGPIRKSCLERFAEEYADASAADHRFDTLLTDVLRRRLFGAAEEKAREQP
jgi:hypothetical protein